MKPLIKELQIPDSFIGKITRFFVNRLQMTILLAILIIVLGISGVLLLPRESLPEIVFPAITIQTLYPGSSPEDVENLVTDKIESKMSDLEDLDEMTSNSTFGYSVVILTFLEDTDMDKMRMEVENALAEVNLPEGAQKPEANVFSTSKLPVLQFSISGAYSIFELTQFAEDIKEDIDSLSGVSDIEISGDLNREFHVNIKPVKMMKYGITQQVIVNALASANTAIPVGEADLSGQRVNLRIDERLTTAQELESVVIQTQTGENIFLRDVASVVDTNEDIESYNKTYVRKDDAQMAFTSVLIEVYRETSADVVRLSDTVKKRLENQRGVLFPTDINIHFSSDLSVDVENDLSSIQTSAFSGLIVVILVLFLFIGFKESLIVSMSIPLTLLITLGTLDYFEISLNGLSILGLIVALGLLVDNSIIVMENMDRLNKLGANAKASAIKGTNQVGYPVLAATLTTIAAFFPLAILPGVMGSFVNSIPRTIIIVLVASFFVAVSITPVVYSQIMKERKKGFLGYLIHKLRLDCKIANFIEKILSLVFVVFLAYSAFKDTVAEWPIEIYFAGFFSVLMALKLFLPASIREKMKGQGAYKKLIYGILKSRLRKALVIAVGVVVLIMSLMLIGSGTVKISLFPPSEPISMTVVVDTPGGTSLEETAEIAKQVETYIKSDEDITSYNITIGGTEQDKAEIIATFKEPDQLSGSGFDVVQRAQNALRRIPGANIIIESGTGNGPPVGKPISLEITGQDLQTMRGLANTYGDIFREIPGVYNIEVSAKDGVPQVYLNILEKKAQTLGLTVSQIAQQLRGMVRGSVATTLKINQEEIDVVVMLDKMNFNDLRAIASLHIQLPSGEMIPLASVATIEETVGLSSIEHVDKARIILVEADLKPGRNVNDVVSEFEEKASEVTIPNGIKRTFGGDIENIQESFADLIRSMGLAVFLVFIILSIQFNSVAQPFAILMTVPMALIGVLNGLALTGNDFGFYAFMGLVALVGIAVNDAIVLMDFMNYLRQTGLEMKDAIVEAGVIRVNPVLATTLTTIGGVLPLAFRDVYYAQFGFSLIFGLLVTTLLTLVYIPVFYSIIEGVKSRHFHGEIENKEEVVKP